MGGLAKKLLATAVEQSLEPIAGAVDFDGTNDYLSRSSDLLGNISGKTFTFSYWVWLDSTSTSTIYDSLNNQFRVAIEAGGSITIRCQNSGGSVVLAATSEPGSVPQRTWAHVLISIDLSNSANRSIYVNGVLKSATWATYSLTGTIWFPAGSHAVGRERQLSINYLKGRLAHLYLDYTYRDLSVEANRRLFITADRKPAEGLEELNPILYLPLTDPTQPGKNLGTGGDFALTGVVARSGRGPNQFNAPYSVMNGSNSGASLRKTNLTVANNFQYAIFSYVAKKNSTVGGTDTVLQITDANADVTPSLQFDHRGTYLELIFRGDNGYPQYFKYSAGVSLRNTHIIWVVDLINVTASLYVNGVDVTPSVVITTFSPAASALSATLLSVANIGARDNNAGVQTGRWGGDLGGIWLDFTEQPENFANPENLAKFVTGTGIDAKPVDLGANGEKPFGTPPLVYLPMYGNNAGKNYGTGGDFTVNSGPFPGARGPNEYWGNRADFDGVTGYLSRNGAAAELSNSKKFSCSFFVTLDSSNDERALFQTADASSASIFGLIRTSSNRILLASGSTLTATTTGSVLPSGSFFVQICVDLSDTSKRFVYIDGLQVLTTWTTYENLEIQFASAVKSAIAARANDFTSKLDGKLSEFYFTTDYIDFSQEANRLKFRDAFGNPVALLPQIEAGEIPNPAIYMRFDPANFGKNHGTGGDFAVNGTITDGGQL